ncbi:MAG: excinuclease ABC subunit UvrB [Alistipes sp.]|nr:excinuclease ABC subunit UvrB [Alistipes sp.]
MDFKLVAQYTPTGDQPEAIAQMVKAVEEDDKRGTTLLGVTGSGKTFTVANVIERLNRPTLVISHNKTLAAQLYGEFKNFFPENAVEYFVSYYDYFQPEAYIPSTDTYIEKDLAINDEIERMRLKTVATLLSGRRDVIVVSSVSCIYGCGNPEAFHASAIELKVGDRHHRKDLLIRLVDALYDRTDGELTPAKFRVTGESIDIMASFGEFGSQCFRILFFDREIEAIYTIDPATGQKLSSLDSVTIYPANLFVSTRDQIRRAVDNIRQDLATQIAYFESEGREIEAQRIKQRVEYDIEMINELGYCSGIENYSRYLDNRAPGSRPFCLMDYFPKDFITVIDESHVTVPQIRGMYGGDHSRKENLVEYGFRLPAALDNRPLQFAEYEAMVSKTIYVSATPADYEIEQSYGEIIEQLIRPTHIVDPPLKLRSAEHPMDEVIEAIDAVVNRGERAIVTTISKASAEEVSRYLGRVGIRNSYIHSDVETLNRIQILEDLRDGKIDVIVGVNLLREGIDLPEVSMVIILDADKDGFLRNVRAITQISGRAARHTNGQALLFGDVVTGSLRTSIIESNRRRSKQVAYNYDNNILPRSAKKSGRGQSTLLNQSSGEETERTSIVAEGYAEYKAAGSEHRAGLQNETTESISVTAESVDRLIAEARDAMESAAKALDFIAAARHRDRMYELQKLRKQL